MAKLGDEETESYVPRSKYLNLVKFQTFKMMKSAVKETINRKAEYNWRAESCSGLVFTAYTICYGAYIAIGGLLFMYIEGNGENNILFQKVQMARESVIRKFPSVSGEALDAFVSEMSSAGVSGLQEMNNTEPKWSYSQSVFFCVTLLTTIGYGHVAPVSEIGKAVCMIYTAFGIPCTLVLLAGFVGRLMCAARSLEKALTCCFKGILKPITIRLFFLGFLTSIVAGGFFFLPALAFSKLEERWTFLDGLYFCFISLTTVGLGDFVPGKHTNIRHRGIYRFGVTLYLLTGVVAVMFLMAVVAEFPLSVTRRQAKIPREPIVIKPPSYGSVMEEKERLLFKNSQFEISYDGLQP